MHKRQRRLQSERVMSSPLMMHKLQTPLPRGDSVITSPAAQGVASAINSTVRLEEASTEHCCAMKPQGSFDAMPWACDRPPECRVVFL
jgi:hypothetical protein